MNEEFETLRQKMFDIKLKIAKIPKSNLLSIEEKHQREESIKALEEEYKIVKKQVARLKFEQKERENEQHKRK